MVNPFPQPDLEKPLCVRTWADVALALGLILLAGAFLWFPLDDMVVDGLFTWHLHHPRTLQGGVELLALYGLLAAALVSFARSSRLYLLTLAVPLGLYLRRHHVDLPAVVALFYLEMILAVGGAVERALRRSSRGGVGAHLERFLLGTITWAAVAISLSAAGRGGPGDLRWAAIGLSVVAFAYARRVPLAYDLAMKLPALRPAHKLLAAFFLTHLACLLARTNVTVYHDSLWYVLRGEYVLAPEGGSIFQSLGLVSQVHYYPKLLELLTLPLSGLGDFSFILAFDVAIFAVLLLVIFLLGRRLGLEPGLAMLAAGLAGTLPAVANVPLTGKPDLFAALLLCLGALHFWDFLERPAWRPALLGLSSVQLSFATKITSLAYGPILILAVLGAGGWRMWAGARTRGCGADVVERPASPGPSGGPAASQAALLAFVGSFLILAALTFRTYLLTGLPTIVPDQLASLWRRLGFSLRYPVGLVIRDRAESMTDLPALAFDFLFAPSQLPLARITWTGNSWLFFLVAALLLGLVHRGSGPRLWPAWSWIPVLVAGAAFALMFNNAERGGDGNYYMFPLILATVLFFVMAVQKTKRGVRVLIACAAAFIVVQVTLGFITAAWAPGTKTLDLDLTRSPFDTRVLRKEILTAEGMSEIGDFLEKVPGLPRVVGLGPEDVTRWLPARFESLRVISHARPDPVATPTRFLGYLQSQQIGFILMPKVRWRNNFGWTFDSLRSQPEVVEIDDRLYRLLDIRAMDLDPERLGEQVRELQRDTIYSLVRELSVAQEIGQRPLQAPWEYAIARADYPTELYVGAASLILADDTEVRYALELPPSKGLLFSAELGLYPLFQLQGISDGVMARVSVSPADGGGAPIVAELEVGPEDGFRTLEVELGRLAGRKVELVLSVSNRAGAAAVQDWVVWARPVVELDETHRRARRIGRVAPSQR